MPEEVSQADAGPDDPGDDEILTCWCGAQGTFEELFDEAVLEEDCGSLGVLHCYCGGDLCVCHWHGEVPCEGCPSCQPDDEDEDHDYEE